MIVLCSSVRAVFMGVLFTKSSGGKLDPGGIIAETLGVEPISTSAVTNCHREFQIDGNYNRSRAVLSTLQRCFGAGASPWSLRGSGHWKVCGACCIVVRGCNISW